MRSIANLVDHFHEEFDFQIITADRDAFEKESYPHVAVDEWNAVGNARVFYAARDKLKVMTLCEVIRATPHDVLYLNSFFNPFFTLGPLIGRRLGRIPVRPTIVAPRGEFSEGAFGLKRRKKSIYVRAVRMLGLYDGVTWHASSEYDARDIARTMGPVADRVVMAPNLPPRLPPGGTERPNRRRRDGEPLRVCFLSRISPKKNLDFALSVMANVRAPVVFHIYGPLEGLDYWSKCEALMKVIRPPVEVRYMGGVEHSRVGEVLGDYDLFFFPTRGENYGHVISEAMLSGTPVLIADTTPWRDLKRLGVGWDLPLSDAAAFAAAVTRAAAMSPEQHFSWRERVRSYAVQRCSAVDVLQANRKLFSAAMHFRT